MPVTPLPVTSPVGIPTALGTYTPSSAASGVFLHEQNAYITYTQVSASSPAGTWPLDCDQAIYFKLEININVDESLFDWCLASGNTYNTFTCMSAIVNSFDSSTGLGTSGYIHFNPGGYTRLSVSSDYEYHNSHAYKEVMIASPLGQSGNLADDAVTLQSFVLNLNSWMRQGGLEYSQDSTEAGRGTTDPEYGWRTDLIC